MVFVCSKCKRDVDTPGLFCPFCGTPAPPPEAEAVDPLIGRTIANKYFVNQRLGRGGMGQVYRATDVVLDRPVAIKLLDRSLLSDPSMVQRFHREGRAASRLNHPNCITILEFGQTEEQALFIAMEFLAGRSLSRLLADEGPLDQARVVRIVAQILSALAEAHGAGVIHRDLKLSNVMVEARRDDPDFVKVLDFGIAKLTESGGGDTQLTAAGIVCGTPGYMSPEQARGEELDPRSDLYSVGVILYELLSGRLPFESATPMGVVTKHMTEAPVPLRERRPDLDLSADLEALTARALAKDREDRPPSAAAMREELLACRVQADGRDRRTPRPERAATAVLPAARLDSPVPRRGPTPTPGSAGGPPPGARKTTPSPAPPRPATPPPAPPEDARAGAASGSRPRRPSWEMEAAPPPGAPPPPSRATPRPAPRGPGGARAQRWRLQGKALWATVGGGLLAVALVAWGLLRSDPFAAPPPAPLDADAGLSLGAPPAPGVALALPPAAPAGAPAGAAAGGAGGAEGAPGPAPTVTGPAGIPAPAPDAARPQVPMAPAASPQGAAPAPQLPAPAPAVSAPQPAPKPVPAAPRPKKGSGVLQDAEGLNVVKIPAATSGQGVLAITASPWAVVSVDGRELGETPRELRAGEGFYRLKVAHPTLGVREKVVVVGAGRRTTVNFDMNGARGGK